jgi:hypothetical protein
VEQVERRALVSETRVSEKVGILVGLDVSVQSVGSSRGRSMGTGLLGTVINSVPRRRPPPEPPPAPQSWKTPLISAGASVRVFSSSELFAISRAVVVANRFRRVLHPATAGKEPRLLVPAVKAMLVESFAAAAESFGTRAAQEWAAGFVFPQSTLLADAGLFAQVDFDFAALCAAKRVGNASDRLSVERVQSMVCRKRFGLDFHRLLRIARGIRIMVPPDFVPCSTPPKLRKKYEFEVSNTVNKLLHQQWVNGTVILLPTELVRAHIVFVHFSFQHWTLKAGKACGRSLCDVANASAGSVFLNGAGKSGKQWIRAECVRLWGVLFTQQFMTWP